MQRDAAEHGTTTTITATALATATASIFPTENPHDNDTLTSNPDTIITPYDTPAAKKAQAGNSSLNLCTAQTTEAAASTTTPTQGSAQSCHDTYSAFLDPPHETRNT